MPLHTTSRILAPFLGQLTDDELNAIPYGVVQLDPEGFVLSVNSTECEHFGWSDSPVGQHYFRDLVPSTNTPEFRGRFHTGVRQERLDDTFQFTFYTGLKPRRTMVRMYFSPQTRSVWLFTATPDGRPIGSVSATESEATETFSDTCIAGLANLHHTLSV